jgi:hypothetical protein
MRICQGCFREYGEDDIVISPAEEISYIYLQTMGVEHTNDLCPRCREQFGVMHRLVVNQ